MSMNVYVCMCTTSVSYTCGFQKRALDLLDLEFWMVLTHYVNAMLQTESGSPARAIHALTC